MRLYLTGLTIFLSLFGYVANVMGLPHVFILIIVASAITIDAKIATMKFITPGYLQKTFSILQLKLNLRMLFLMPSKLTDSTAMTRTLSKTPKLLIFSIANNFLNLESNSRGILELLRKQRTQKVFRNFLDLNEPRVEALAEKSFASSC